MQRVVQVIACCESSGLAINIELGSERVLLTGGGDDGLYIYILGKSDHIEDLYILLLFSLISRDRPVAS